MADWSLPTLTTAYEEFLTQLKARDEDLAKLFDGTGDNVPSGTIRWNSANKKFEKFDGTNWSALIDQYNINVAQLQGKNVNDNATDTSALWTASKIISQLNQRANTTLSNVSDSTILNKLKNVDGSGSGLDADLLDGLNSSAFVRSDVDDTISGKIRFTNTSDVTLTSNGAITIGPDDNLNLSIDNDEIQARNNGAAATLALNANGGTVTANGSRVLTTADEGSGKGLDADTVDGIHGASFARSDANDSINASWTWASKYGGWGGQNGAPAINFGNSDIIGLNGIVFNDISNGATEGVVFPVIDNPDSLDDYATINIGSDRQPYIYPDASSSTKHKIWHDGDFDSDEFAHTVFLGGSDYGSPTYWKVATIDREYYQLHAKFRLLLMSVSGSHSVPYNVMRIDFSVYGTSSSTPQIVAITQINNRSDAKFQIGYVTYTTTDDAGKTHYCVDLYVKNLEAYNSFKGVLVATACSSYTADGVAKKVSPKWYNPPIKASDEPSGISYPALYVEGRLQKDNKTLNLNGSPNESVGSLNAVIGYDAMAAMGGDSTFNTAVGAAAASLFQSGYSNTFVGSLTGVTPPGLGESDATGFTNGSNVTCIGYSAGAADSPHDLGTSANNVIVLGNNDVTAAYIKVNWTVTSDKRDKTDIKNIPYGLDYITKLQPRQFYFDDRSRYWERVTDEKGNVVAIDKSKAPDGSKKDSRPMWGFISQEILASEKELGITESIVVDTKNEEKLALKETALIPVLVNAVKELKAELDSVKDELAKLKEDCCK